MSKKDIALVVKSELETMAEQRGLVDSNGRPNVGRMLSLIADATLKDAVSTRSADKNEAGFNSLPKGLMLQINKRIKEAFGLSVADNDADGEFQEAIALCRSAVKRKIESQNIDWFAENAEAQDKAAKAELYDLISRLAGIYRGKA